MPVSNEVRRALLPLKDRIVAGFNGGHWHELGVLTDCTDLVENHPRLLRSLDFGDDDYAGHAPSTLLAMLDRDPKNFGEIRRYVDDKLEGGGTSISSAASTGPRIYFTPGVFTVPADAPDPNLVTVMMPFAGAFTPVYAGIRQVAARHGMTCQRADDIWDHSTGRCQVEG